MVENETKDLADRSGGEGVVGEGPDVPLMVAKESTAPPVDTSPTAAQILSAIVTFDGGKK